jgi:hypothetical protein
MGRTFPAAKMGETHPPGNAAPLRINRFRHGHLLLGHRPRRRTIQRFTHRFRERKNWIARFRGV